MSSRRSRSGGRWISIVLSRKSRSCRKRPSATSWPQVRVGGGEDPDVGPARPRRADPLELAGLEDPQQLGLLRFMRHVRDLVEEERAPVGELEPADAVGLGVGEGALHVAEELALEDALGEAAHVHRRRSGLRRARRRRRAARARRPCPCPVPFSPVMSTLASDGPTRSMISSTGCIAADSAMSVGVPSRAAARSRPRGAPRGGARGRARPGCAGWRGAARCPTASG